MGLWRGFVYSAMSRSFCTMRPASERKGNGAADSADRINRCGVYTKQVSDPLGPVGIGKMSIALAAAEQLSVLYSGAVFLPIRPESLPGWLLGRRR